MTNRRVSKDRRRREMTERRRIARHKLRVMGTEAETFAYMVGWCQDEIDLPKVRKQTHDIVIRLSGDLRIGGVTWRQWSGPDAIGVCFMLAASAGAEYVEILKRTRRKLEEYGGFLIVASVPVADRPSRGETE